MIIRKDTTSAPPRLQGTETLCFIAPLVHVYKKTRCCATMKRMERTKDQPVKDNAGFWGEKKQKMAGFA